MSKDLDTAAAGLPGGLNWAVLGTGVIANEMAAGLQQMGKSLYAVGNRTYSKAVAFAEKYGIKKVYNTIDEMFTDEKVDIIYITSPHNTHYAFMKKALENGKVRAIGISNFDVNDSIWNSIVENCRIVPQIVSWRRQ